MGYNGLQDLGVGDLSYNIDLMIMTETLCQNAVHSTVRDQGLRLFLL